MTHAFAVWIGWVTGLALVGPAQPDLTRIATGLGMLICYGVACRFFALQGNREPRPWMWAGLSFGMIAVALLLMLGDRESEPAR